MYLFITICIVLFAAACGDNIQSIPLDAAVDAPVGRDAGPGNMVTHPVDAYVPDAAPDAGCHHHHHGDE